MSLTAVVAPVVEELERLGIRYRIGGSVASSAHGIARATNDVDIVAELRHEHIEPLVRALADRYLMFPELLALAVRTRSCTNLIHKVTGYKVDLFVRPESAYDALAMARTVLRTMDPGERAFSFTSAEDILLRKLLWYRAGGEVSDRQWADVAGILRAREQDLDRGYLREWAAKLHVVDLLDRAEDQERRRSHPLG
jgi:hypothetical protein